MDLNASHVKEQELAKQYDDERKHDSSMYVNRGVDVDDKLAYDIDQQRDEFVQETL
jgi:hypothetical protein